MRLSNLAKSAWVKTMQINYDFKANEWIAFQKKEGKPFLAYAPTLSEAMSLIFEMIQEDKND